MENKDNDGAGGGGDTTESSSSDPTARYEPYRTFLSNSPPFNVHPSKPAGNDDQSSDDDSSAPDGDGDSEEDDSADGYPPVTQYGTFVSKTTVNFLPSDEAGNAEQTGDDAPGPAPASASASASASQVKGSGEHEDVAPDSHNFSGSNQSGDEDSVDTAASHIQQHDVSADRADDDH